MHCYLYRFLLLFAWIIFPTAVCGQDTTITAKPVTSATDSAQQSIPKSLLEPESEEELAQYDILFAISQREYKLAEQLFEIASQDDDRKQLIATANFGPQLRGLASFWKSIDSGLQRVKVGDQLELPPHLIARDDDLSAWNSGSAALDQSPENFDSPAGDSLPVSASGQVKTPASTIRHKAIIGTIVEKSEFSLTLSNPDADQIVVSTKQTQIPTAVAVALFRFQFPNSALTATELFERFDYPGNAQLLSSKSSDSQDTGSSKSRNENQSGDHGAKPRIASASGQINDTRIPVPSDADQKKSRSEIRRLFDTLYLGKTQQNIQERAQKLLQVAKETDPNTNAADLYVLLDEALSASESIADIDLSLSISLEIANRFQVDPDATFISMAKNVLSKVREPSSAESILGEIRIRVDRWIDDDNYAMAKKALTEFSPTIRRLRLPHWIEYISDEQNRIRILSKKYSELVASVGATSVSEHQGQGTPEKKPNWPPPDVLSASQCELIAKFIIFEKENLETGLPYLARSSSVNLQEIGKIELKASQSVDERIQLAEKWLQIKDQPFAIQRARNIYSQILLTVTGLTEARVRKKLEEIPESPGKSPSMRDYLGKTFRITWIYIDGSGSKEEQETLVFKPDGTYRREQPAGAVEGTWTELAGEISTKITTRAGCSEGYKLLPGGFISGMHFRGDKPVARCQGQVSLQP